MDLASLLAPLPPTARMLSVRSGVILDAAGIQAATAGRVQNLHSLGLRHGDLTVVAEADPVTFIIAIFACWAAGLTAVAVNPALAPDEQRNVIAATAAKAWLGTNALDLPAITPGSSDTTPLTRSEPALILMTSGTTGRPKGIAHSLDSLAARIALNRAEIGDAVMARSLCVLPVFFGHGLIGNGLTPLFSGGEVHFWPVPTMTELQNFGPYIDTHRIGFMSSVPSFWKLATRLSPKPATPLQRVHVGSAPLSIEHWREIAAWSGTPNVLNMFGMTETANWIGGSTLEDAEGRDGHVGTIWGGRFGIRTDVGNIAPHGRGEVLVKSPSIMLGYWHRPDLDAEAFIEGWFRTGDTGELKPDGTLTLVGRIKSEINRGGIKIQAEEIDMLLERHPDIAEACAFSIPDPVAGEAVAAAIVLKAGMAFDPEAIKAWCRIHARADAVPSRLYALDAIPRNDRGKIVRADVRRAAGAAP